MVIPLIVESQRALTTVHEDGQEIAQSIPDFQIQNGEVMLEQEEESFIHQTNTFLFFFDPAGEMTTDTIGQNMETLGIPIGIGVMEDEFYFSILAYDLGLPYSQLDGLTGEYLRGMLNDVGTYNFLYGVLFFFIFLVISFFNVAFEILIYTLFANIIASFMRKRYRFGENWKIITVASTVPIVVFTLLNLFGIYPFLQLELKALAALVFYYIAVKNDPDKQEP